MIGRLLAVWQWCANHRLIWGAIAAVIWAAVMYQFVDGLLIAALCGAAFGVVSAVTLPRPPK
ncbi:hypothetical protein OG589_11885 [Sphaerisporangium sp. NBC_01403]|uniref:hypothetical protein n=1 Tax=Sphaerisporangium sp. NBC_01403 TaxID=2903599 RepID=UPI00324EB8D1